MCPALLTCTATEREDSNPSIETEEKLGMVEFNQFE